MLLLSKGCGLLGLAFYFRRLVLVEFYFSSSGLMVSHPYGLPLRGDLYGGQVKLLAGAPQGGSISSSVLHIPT